MRGHAPPIPVMHIRAPKSWKRDSNPRPTDYESVALPTALFQHNKTAPPFRQATFLLYRFEMVLARTFLKKHIPIVRLSPTGCPRLSRLSDCLSARLSFSAIVFQSDCLCAIVSAIVSAIALQRLPFQLSFRVCLSVIAFPPFNRGGPAPDLRQRITEIKSYRNIKYR